MADIISANPSSFIFPVIGGTQEVGVTKNDTILAAVTQWNIVKSDNDFTAQLISTSSGSCNINITMPENQTAYSTEHYIIVEGVLGGSVNVQTYIRFRQEANLYVPVWKDSYFTFSENLGNIVNYTIYDVNNSTTIYSGKAVSMPDQTAPTINITKLVRDYLNNHFPTILDKSEPYSLNEYSKYIQIIVDGSVQGAYTIYNSWGYGNLPEHYSLSEPIRNVVDRRQYFVYSLYHPSTDNYVIPYEFITRHNLYFTKYSVTLDGLTQFLIVDKTIRNQPIYNRISIGTDVYNIIDSCCDYCLYYSNANGGWDSLLIYGNAIKTDKISSNYYNQHFDNTTYGFEKTKYLNVITPTYKLYTDWFTDDEQSRLYHLLESTEVYLHNLKTDKIEPVNITNNTCEYKTFTNNGKKKWYNTINVEVAQERLRQ